MLKVNVQENTLVKDLNQIVLGEPAYFIHNGAVLHSNFEIGYYNIKENDFIVVVDKPSIPKQYIDNISVLSDVSQCMELAKLQDMQFQKMERKPRVYRMFLSTFESVNEPSNIPQIPIKIPHKPSKPCSDPLPKFWSDYSHKMAPQVINPEPSLASLCQRQAGNADAAFP